MFGGIGGAMAGAAAGGISPHVDGVGLVICATFGRFVVQAFEDGHRWRQYGRSILERRRAARVAFSEPDDGVDQFDLPPEAGAAADAAQARFATLAKRGA